MVEFFFVLIFNIYFQELNIGNKVGPMVFPGGSVVENSLAYAGLIPEFGKYPGEGNGNPLQYPRLVNPMKEEHGGLQSMGLQKSQTQLSNETVSRSNKHRNRQCTIIDRCAGAGPNLKDKRVQNRRI